MKRALLALIVLAVALAVVIACRHCGSPAPAPMKPIANGKTTKSPRFHASGSAPVSEGGLLVAAAPDSDAMTDELTDEAVDLCAHFETYFTLGPPSRAECARRTPEALDDARRTCRDKVSSDDALTYVMAAIDDGRITPNLDVLRACAEFSPSCDMDKAFGDRAALTGHVARGQPCDSRFECAPPLVCLAPDFTRQELVCGPPAVEGETCDDDVKPCAAKLDCVDGVCARVHPGTRCGDAWCTPGLVCDAAEKCRRPDGAGERCDTLSQIGGRGRGTCAQDLLCVDQRCIAPVETGAACTPASSICDAACTVCRVVVPGEPAVCAPRGEEGEPCAHEDDCNGGLTCRNGACELAATPGNGERCARIPECTGDDCESCTEGLHCVNGVCSDGADGAPCTTSAQCSGFCTAEKTCRSLPSSGPCVDDGRCAAGSQCVAGSCAHRPRFGEACAVDEQSASCTDELVCLEGRCLPRRLGGGKCRVDDDCESRKCMAQGEGGNVCRATRAPGG